MGKPTASPQHHFSAEQLELIAHVQSGFPIVHDPYAELGERFGVSADEAFNIIHSMREDGYIRRMDPVFDSFKLGYISTLCALCVPEERLDEVAEFINGFYNITHNYLRSHKYNVWFTVIAHGEAELLRIIKSIEGFAGAQVLQLPALRLFKIRVDFNIKGAPRTASEQKTIVPKRVTAANISEQDKAIIRVVQVHGFTGRHPYQDIADELAAQGLVISEQQVIETLRAWKQAGIIRRFGITLRHRKLGFSYNAMVVWDVPDGEVESAGAIMARADAVSHCYERPRVADWQSNLYTMIHGQSREQCDKIIDEIKSALSKADISVAHPQMLFTLKELKKQSMKYFCEEELR